MRTPPDHVIECITALLIEHFQRRSQEYLAITDETAREQFHEHHHDPVAIHADQGHWHVTSTPQPEGRRYFCIMWFRGMRRAQLQAVASIMVITSHHDVAVGAPVESNTTVVRNFVRQCFADRTWWTPVPPTS